MSQRAVKFYFSASPRYMFRAAHTPILRSTILTVSTAIGTIHSRSQIVSVTSSQLRWEEGIYRVIHKSLRDFRPLLYSSRDVHAEGEHVNRGRDIPRFCPTLQVIDMSTLGDAADVNPVIKFLPHTLQPI